MSELVLSSLPKTWLIDVDGTIVKHNGHQNGEDVLLDGALDFLKTIPSTDMIIFITARLDIYKETLESFFIKNNIIFNHIIYNAKVGERILINDNKPSGLKMGYAINKERDAPLDLSIIIDKDL